MESTLWMHLQIGNAALANLSVCRLVTVRAVSKVLGNKPTQPFERGSSSKGTVLQKASSNGTFQVFGRGCLWKSAVEANARSKVAAEMAPVHLYPKHRSRFVCKYNHDCAISCERGEGRSPRGVSSGVSYPVQPGKCPKWNSLLEKNSFDTHAHRAEKGMTSGEMADPDCAIASDSGRLDDNSVNAWQAKWTATSFHAKHWDTCRLLSPRPVKLKYYSGVLGQLFKSDPFPFPLAPRNLKRVSTLFNSHLSLCL